MRNKNMGYVISLWYINANNEQKIQKIQNKNMTFVLLSSVTSRL